MIETELELPNVIGIARPAAARIFESRCAVLGMGLAHIKRQRDLGIKEMFRGLPHCESPIERELLPWLIFGDWHGFLTAPVPVFLLGDAVLPKGDIVIAPQFKVGRYRADFAILCRHAHGIKTFFVECDGRDFHNDAARDWGRDAYLLSLDIDTVRLTGSEITRDPEGCLQRVVLTVTAWKDGQ